MSPARHTNSHSKLCCFNLDADEFLEKCSVLGRLLYSCAPSNIMLLIKVNNLIVGCLKVNYAKDFPQGCLRVSHGPNK
jgi:hypothetical protein